MLFFASFAARASEVTSYRFPPAFAFAMEQDTHRGNGDDGSANSGGSGSGGEGGGSGGDKEVRAVLRNIFNF